MLETPVREIQSRDVPAVALRRVRVYADFQLILGGAILLTALVALGGPVPFLEPIRLLLALAYILYIPGYCLACALFPNAADLDGIERIGLNFSLSVAVVPLVALLLSILPWGLRPLPILLGELGATTLFAGLASWRRSRLSTETYHASLWFDWRPGVWWHTTSPADRRVVVTFAAAVILVVGLASTILEKRVIGNFTTEFSIVGANSSANNYPRTATPNQHIGVTASIVNRERDTRSYRIETWVMDGWNPSRRALVMQTDTVSLSPGETQQLPLTWQMPWTGDDQEVEFLLFTDGHAEPYRRLRIWVNVVGSDSSSPSLDAPVSSIQAAPLAPPWGGRY